MKQVKMVYVTKSALTKGVEYNEVRFTKKGKVIKNSLPSKIGEYLVIMPDETNSVAIIKVKYLIKEHWDMMKYKSWCLDIEY